MSSEADIGTCSICLDNILKTSNPSFLPCSHVFHSECIDPWIKETPLCPMCKISIHVVVDEKNPECIPDMYKGGNIGRPQSIRGNISMHPSELIEWINMRVQHEEDKKNNHSSLHDMIEETMDDRSSPIINIIEMMHSWPQNSQMDALSNILDILYTNAMIMALGSITD